MIRYTFTLLFFFCTASLLMSQEVPFQDSSRYVVIRMLDGNQMTGRVVGQDAQTVSLATDNYGIIQVRKDQIKIIEPAHKKDLVDRGYWNESVYATRYLFGPSGHNLRKGEGYYQNTLIIINQASVGVTDHFTIGGGVIPFFLFAGAPTPVWITPKFNLPIESEVFNAGFGMLAGTVLGEEDTGFGILYGNTTFGSRTKNLNISLGYGFIGGELANAPTVSISGMIQTSPKLALITENYFLGVGGSNYILPSFGLRFIMKDIAIDGALIFPTETGNFFVAIPWLSLIAPFGGKVK